MGRFARTLVTALVAAGAVFGGIALAGNGGGGPKPGKGCGDKHHTHYRQNECGDHGHHGHGDDGHHGHQGGGGGGGGGDDAHGGPARGGHHDDWVPVVWRWQQGSVRCGIDRVLLRRA
jgi:hypothetical protein